MVGPSPLNLDATVVVGDSPLGGDPLSYGGAVVFQGLLVISWSSCTGLDEG